MSGSRPHPLRPLPRTPATTRRRHPRPARRRGRHQLRRRRSLRAQSGVVGDDRVRRPPRRACEGRRGRPCQAQANRRSSAKSGFPSTRGISQHDVQRGAAGWWASAPSRRPGRTGQPVWPDPGRSSRRDPGLAGRPQRSRWRRHPLSSLPRGNERPGFGARAFGCPGPPPILARDAVRRDRPRPRGQHAARPDHAG